MTGWRMLGTVPHARRCSSATSGVLRLRLVPAPPSAAPTLHVPQVRIDALGPAQQALVRAAFDDPALVHHDDAVGMPHGTQAVGDDEDGSPWQMCAMLRCRMASLS